eukprot:3184775-Prymnesium_polylepis.1
MERLTAQELQNVAWAFSASRANVPALFDGVLLEAQQRGLESLEPCDVAYLAASFASIGHPAPLFLQGLAAVAEPRLADFDPPQLSALCFGLSRADVPQFYAAVIEHLPQRLHTFGPRELSSTVLTCIRACLLYTSPSPRDAHES